MLKIKILLLLNCVWVVGIVSAQDNNKISSETVEKTYIVKSNGKVVKNSVKIKTERSQDIAFKEEDMGTIDQDRAVVPTKITKTVLIDSDDDDGYDEKIVFSYMAESDSDFTLITNNDEIMVALEEGENLNIIESVTIALKNLKSNQEAYIFTNKKGKNIEFFIENYVTLGKEPKEQKLKH